MVGRVLTACLYGLGVLLFYIGASALVRWLGRHNPKIVLYHDCAEQESEYLAGLDCTTSPENFSKHIAYLARNYSIVPLEVILSGDVPPRAVAITFDDGYASVYENAFPVLKKNHALATIYLISSVVNNRALVWVNELNYLVRQGSSAANEEVWRLFGGNPDSGPAEIISTCRLNYNPAKMQTLLAKLRQLANLSPVEHAGRAKLYLTWHEIEEMSSAGIEFGNHSRTHPNMERLSDDEQLAEIEGAQRELEEHLPHVRGFAHPFGHRGPRTAYLASTLGLLSAADESVAGLFARLEVVEPLKAILRKRLDQRVKNTPTGLANGATAA